MIPRNRRLAHAGEAYDRLGVNVVNDVQKEEPDVLINLRLPLNVKIDCDNLYIERIKQNPKVKLTRSSVYREIFEAGVRKLMEEKTHERQSRPTIDQKVKET